MGKTELTKRGININRITDKQKMFVFEYLNCMDAKKAAIAAGYSAKCAAVQGAKLLKHKLVKKAIGKLLNDADIDQKLTIENVLQEIAYCSFRNVVDFVNAEGNIVVNDLRKLPIGLQRSIDGFKCRQILNQEGEVVGQEIEVKMASKVAALRLASDVLKLSQPNTINNNLTVLDWDKLLESIKTKVNANIIDAS